MTFRIGDLILYDNRTSFDEMAAWVEWKRFIEKEDKDITEISMIVIGNKYFPECSYVACRKRNRDNNRLTGLFVTAVLKVPKEFKVTPPPSYKKHKHNG